MTETYDRDFKGIWIPKEIWLTDELSTNEKIILMEIDSLDGESGCFASNEYLAEFCKCSESLVDKAIKRLKETGYIYTESFDGRTRVLRSRLSSFTLQSRKFYASESQILRHSNIEDNNSYKDISSLRSDISIGKRKETTAKDSDADTVNEIYEAYNTICKSLTKCRMRSEARNSAIRARIKQSGKDKVIEAFRLAEQSDFLTGRVSVSDKPFVANIDWILKQSNFIKILEGNYKNRPSRKAGNGNMYMGSNDGFELVTDFDIPEERRK